MKAIWLLTLDLTIYMSMSVYLQSSKLGGADTLLLLRRRNFAMTPSRPNTFSPIALRSAIIVRQPIDFQLRDDQLRDDQAGTSSRISFIKSLCNRNGRSSTQTSVLADAQQSGVHR